jgi:hypothetical protein
MITLGAKVYFGLTVFALVAASILGLASGGDLLGILSFGWSGPIGNNLGYTVLIGTSAAAFFMGVVTTAFRDADAVPVEQVAGTDTLPAALPPSHLSAWPVVAAFGVAALVIGLIIEPALVGVGIVMLVASAIEWGVTAWADQATGDPDANHAIRNRLMQPLEVPAMAVIGIAFFVFLMSSLLLSLSKWGSIGVFATAATLILVVASLVAARPTITRGIVTALLVFGGLSLVLAGIIGIGMGHREFHDVGSEGEEHAADEDHGDEATEDNGSDGEQDATDEGDDTSSGDSEE